MKNSFIKWWLLLGTTVSLIWLRSDFEKVIAACSEMRFLLLSSNHFVKSTCRKHKQSADTSNNVETNCQQEATLFFFPCLLCMCDYYFLTRQNNQIRSKHALPVLDYPVEQGIQPCITPKQLDFHYNKHHKTYVDKLNQLVAGTPFENMPLDQIIVKTAFDPKSVPVFNNAAQHFNHSFYWKCLRPKPSQAEAIPTTIKQKIEQTWGSFEKFQAEVCVNKYLYILHKFSLRKRLLVSLVLDGAGSFMTVLLWRFGLVAMHNVPLLKVWSPFWHVRAFMITIYTFW